MKTREIHEKSAVPIYGIGAVIALYSLIFPLYKLVHFLILAALCVGVYMELTKLFPGRTVTVEEPVSTGNADVDSLIAEGDTAVKEMKRLQSSISNGSVKTKIGELITITGKIFANLRDDPGDYRQIKRFSEYFLPTTMKLLNAYDRFSSEGAAGENVSGTMRKIEDVLDSTIEAYRSQYDALFTNQALDIETDIEVLKTMMKREGLIGRDFE